MPALRHNNRTPMGKRKVTQELYDEMITAFRQTKGEPLAKSARLAGVDVRTMQRAWEFGWPTKNFEAIQTIFEREQARARALLERERQEGLAQIAKERADSETQAANARKQEGQTVELMRGIALRQVAAGAKLTTDTAILHDHVKTCIATLTKLSPNDAKYMTAEKALNLSQRIATICNSIASFARTAMELERLHLGEPTHQVNVVYQQQNLTRDELRIRMSNAIEVLKDLDSLDDPPLQLVEGEPTIGIVEE